MRLEAASGVCLKHSAVQQIAPSSSTAKHSTEHEQQTAPALAAPGRAQLYSSRLLARLSVDQLAAGAAPGL